MDEIDAADASNLLDRRTEAAIVRALNYLKQSQGGDGRWNGEDAYMYGHYYAALVMYQAGPTEFERWYPGIRDILLARQSAEGSFVTGSTKIIYDTAIATIILSIPYGYMPAYQR